MNSVQGRTGDRSSRSPHPHTRKYDDDVAPRAQNEEYSYAALVCCARAHVVFLDIRPSRRLFIVVRIFRRRQQHNMYSLRAITIIIIIIMIIIDSGIFCAGIYVFFFCISESRMRRKNNIVSDIRRCVTQCNPMSEPTHSSPKQPDNTKKYIIV